MIKIYADIATFHNSKPRKQSRNIQSSPWQEYSEIPDHLTALTLLIVCSGRGNLINV